MIVQDEQQRELEIVTQWQGMMRFFKKMYLFDAKTNRVFFEIVEPYSKLRLQMRCENIIASTKKDFSVLNMVTDSWIPACGVWVGDYPYLDRTAFRDFASSAASSSPKGSQTMKPIDEWKGSRLRQESDLDEIGDEDLNFDSRLTVDGNTDFSENVRSSESKGPSDTSQRERSAPLRNRL